MTASNEPLAAAATGARTITEADLANPTDVDASIPLWMQALRARNKREDILGFARTEPSSPPVHVATNDTDPMPMPLFANASEAAAMAMLEDLASPISVRPAANAIDVTRKPKEPLAPPASRDVFYVEPSPKPFTSTMPMNVVPAARTPTPTGARAATTKVPSEPGGVSTRERWRRRARALLGPNWAPIVVFVFVIVFFLTGTLLLARRTFSEWFSPGHNKASSR